MSAAIRRLSGPLAAGCCVLGAACGGPAKSVDVLAGAKTCLRAHGYGVIVGTHASAPSFSAMKDLREIDVVLYPTAGDATDAEERLFLLASSEARANGIDLGPSLRSFVHARGRLLYWWPGRPPLDVSAVRGCLTHVESSA